MHELLEESRRRLVLKIGACARCLVSNALAIAAVTETLLQVLSKVLPASLVSGAQVTVFGGDTGAVEVASNFVRNCINGFVFLSQHSWRRAQPGGNHNRQISKRRAAFILGRSRAVQSRPTLCLTFRTRAFPLPKNTDLFKAIPIAASDLRETAEITRILQPRFDRIFSVMPKAPPPATVIPPSRDLLHRSLRVLPVTGKPRSDCFRLGNSCRVGYLPPAGSTYPFTAHDFFGLSRLRET
jgi:hypothetical protein